MNETYTLHRGYDETEDRSYLVRTWPDGTRELMIRPGRDNTCARWSPPITLAPEPVLA